MLQKTVVTALLTKEPDNASPTQYLVNVRSWPNQNDSGPVIGQPAKTPDEYAYTV